MIKITNITKTYDKNEQNILDGISLEIKDGEILGIVGVNGCGKSTLISILAGVIKPTSGDINIDTDKVCYVPQNMVFFEHLSVKSNLELFASGLYKTKQEVNDNIDRVVKAFSLEEVISQKVKDISGGNKRKLNIAISFLKDGDIFLLDEPIVNIDYDSRIKIEEVLNSLKANGKIVVLVSHHRTFLENVCTKILVIENGKQKYIGEINEEIVSKL